MKTLFIESKYNQKISLPSSVIESLKAKHYKQIALFTTIQFIDNLANIKKQLEKAKIKVMLLKAAHCKYAGQLLGCSIQDFSIQDSKTSAKGININAFLYIGDGMFHPLALKLSNDKPVFAYNPFTKKLAEITENETKQIKQQQKAALVKFYSSKEIGILISTKPGQLEIKKAFLLKKKFPEKNFYFFIFDTLEVSQLENFPFVECFINTACRRVSYDDFEKSQKKILDVSSLL